jgi:hypothetical protein
LYRQEIRLRRLPALSYCSNRSQKEQ